jgi:hypothetical protein
VQGGLSAKHMTSVCVWPIDCIGVTGISTILPRISGNLTANWLDQAPGGVIEFGNWKEFSGYNTSKPIMSQIPGM